MNSLPVELLEAILEFADLPREELLANRLICRRLCGLFTPRAFRTIRTNNFTRDSFDHLCSIAQTSHLAECVVEYEYRLVELLNQPNHHEVDNMLPLLEEMSSGSPRPLEDSPVNLEGLTQHFYEQHQIYLHQQDILGTFYDTLSIIQALPSFPGLQVIRILDFENFENTDYTSRHQAAVVRAFYNIVKTLSFTKILCFPNLGTLELDRFDYEVLTPFWNEDSEHPSFRNAQLQFNNALLRIPCLKINKLTSRKLPNHQYLAAWVLATALMEAGTRLEELHISDGSGVKVPYHCQIPNEGFPWHYVGNIEYSRFIEAGKGRIFPNLRKLNLSGHRNVSLLNFAGMFMCLTPGVLKELSLESLGMFCGKWEDFFRIVAPKTMWVDTREEWPGEKSHYAVQSFIRNDKMNATLETVGDWFKQQKEYINDEPWRNPWGGVALESCRIRHICYITYRGLEGNSRDEIHISRLKQFEKWMVEGLEEDEYELFPLST